MKRNLNMRVVHHVVGGVIVAGWLGVIAFRVAGTPTVELDPNAVPPLPVNAVTRYYGVYWDGNKVGFAESSRAPLEEGGARFIDRAYWRFKAQGVVKSMTVETDAVADERWLLRDFSMRIDAGAAKIGVKGKVEGKRMDVELTTGGKTVEESIPLTDPVLLPGMVRAYVASQRPRPGASYRVQIYNPIIRAAEPLEVLVVGPDDHGLQVREILRGSLRTTAWLDPDGVTLREESASGFEMRAEPKDEALRLPADRVPDLVFAVAVPVQGRIDDPASARHLVLDFEGADLDRFPALQGDRQLRVGNRVTIESESVPDSAGTRLPFDGAFGVWSSFHPTDAEAHRAEWAAALAAEPLIQSGDPQIRRTAASIVGNERDPARAARKIYDWVFHNVRKETSVGVPSAVEVLENQSGDCNEHTVLFTALARASGIPTRMAAGIVYTHARGGGDGMYYHAWPEVWLKDRWVAVDPTLGQMPADAAHVRFVVGGLDRQVDILSLIGSLEATVVEVATTSAAPTTANEETPEDTP